MGWNAADSRPIEAALFIPFKFSADRATLSTWQEISTCKVHLEGILRRFPLVDDVTLAVVEEQLKINFLYIIKCKLLADLHLLS